MGDISNKAVFGGVVVCPFGGLNTVYTLACFYKQIYAREYLLYIGLALFVICGIILFLRMNNTKNNEAFLSADCKDKFE